MSSELLDIYDEAQRHLGTKPRDQVHRDGDWHRSFHLWVASCIDGLPSLVLQRRALDKDSFAGLLDISAAGHLSAGEQLQDGVREAHEELGLDIGMEDVEVLGIRAQVGVPHPGFVNREFCQVALVRDDRPIEQYQFDPGELAGVARIGLAELQQLIQSPDVPVLIQQWDGARSVQLEIDGQQLVWQDYLQVLLIMVERFLAGQRPLSI